MANVHDYYEYLTDQIEISPANSQEELNAAQTIADLMKESGLETNVEEFDAPALARLPFAVLLILLFVGCLIAGIGGTVLAIVGTLIALACVAVLVLDHLGRNLFEHFGPSARSQNVVAMHEASGPLVAKGNRPVVIMAHYDSPRESFLYGTAIARYLPTLRRYTPWCVVAAGVGALFQILLFLPEPVRRVFWVIGFLAAAPALIVGIGSIAERFSSCSLGANDNKSSVAALLGAIDAIFTPSEGASARLASRKRRQEPESTRHGEEVIRSLGILPESCEIEYVDAADDEPAAEAVDEQDQQMPLDDEDALAGGATANLAQHDASGGGEAAEGAFRLVEAEAPAQESDPDATRYYRPQVADVARRAALFDLPDPGEEASDPFLTPVPSAPAPRPSRASIADRLSFADDQDVFRAHDDFDGLDVPVPSYENDLPEDEDAVEQPAPAAAPAPAPARKPFSLFGRKKREQESLADYLGVEEDYDAKSAGREIGSWEALEEQDEEFSRRRRNDPTWKGGAAVAEELRGSEEQPSADEAAAPGKYELLCHDIWFVALGANGLDHAGMKAFIAKHRPQLRGAFVINLDCVGAGNLAVLSSEGMGNTRRVDRRISRLLKGVAKDLDTELLDVPFDWNATDATPAMRSSMRAATIMGVNEMNLPALSRTPEDVPENVDLDQAELVSEMVVEFIRRS